VNILKSAIKITSVIQYVLEGNTLVKMYTANTLLSSLEENSSGYSSSITSEIMEEHGLAKEMTVDMT
jgi:hypothetical protein